MVYFFSHSSCGNLGIILTKKTYFPLLFIMRPWSFPPRCSSSSVAFYILIYLLVTQFSSRNARFVRKNLLPFYSLTLLLRVLYLVYTQPVFADWLDDWTYILLCPPPCVVFPRLLIVQALFISPRAVLRAVNFVSSFFQFKFKYRKNHVPGSEFNDSS
jgi:hypothetical protein